MLAPSDVVPETLKLVRAVLEPTWPPNTASPVMVKALAPWTVEANSTIEPLIVTALIVLLPSDTGELSVTVLLLVRLPLSSISAALIETAPEPVEYIAPSTALGLLPRLAFVVAATIMSPAPVDRNRAPHIWLTPAAEITSKLPS